MTFEEFKKKVIVIGNEIKDFDRSLLASKDLERRMKARIFNVNGGKDKDGKILPVYSPGYKARKGKIASNWDLQDTGDLLQSLQAIHSPSEKQTILAFANNEELEKAKKLEGRSGQTIFALSKNEIDESTKMVANVITKEVLKRLKTIFG